MTAPESEYEERRAGPRWRLIVAGLAALLALALAGLWSQRRPIATGFVDRELARRGVPASYRISRFGVGTQRLEDVRIGDPAQPDLTADWAEIRLAMGLTGPRLVAVSAGGVRLRGRIADGKLSLGAIDRLLPPSSGAPFALPDIDLRLDDAGMRLDTPAGAIGLAITGRGNLRDGFRGKAAAVSPLLAAGGCSLAGPRGYFEVAIEKLAPSVKGPLSAARIRCGDAEVAAPRLALDLAFNEALDRWRGRVGIDATRVAGGGATLAALRGEVGIEGSAAAIAGTLRARSGIVATAAAVAGEANADLRYAIDFARDRQEVTGSVGAGGIAVRRALIQPLLAGLRGGEGTPVGPVGNAAAAAIERAAANLTATADVALLRAGSEGGIRLRRIDLSSASGMRLTGGGAGLGYYWPRGAARLDGGVTLSGGGMPTARLVATQPRLDAGATGTLTIEPYAVAGARLELAPLRFAAQPDGTTRIASRVTVDGPLGDGRVRGLSLPVEGQFAADGSFRINGGCAPLSFENIDIAGTAIGRSRLPLCPVGPALASNGRGGFAAGARVPAPRLAGRIGGTPLTLAASELRAGTGGIEARAFAARLGAGEAVTRLDVASLQGRFSAAGIGGRFAGLSGSIANVPLLVSEGVGDWRLGGGVLDLRGGLRVADAAAAPRFNPLSAPEMRLRLADGQIRAEGSLVHPADGTRVTDVTIEHRLADGSGRARLSVPDLRFTEALQPEALTPLTLGVIANVRGAISGRGEIVWNARGVTSTSRFATDGIDLAAAFGPVKGIKGEILFSDLLGMVTPPGQVATIQEVNPGIAANDGVVRYQLLPGFLVAVEGARWPFSGGELLLEPTVLDFAEQAERRLTFRVQGLDAAEFVEQFEFKNIAVTGTFDGTVPMIFDRSGGRIENGRVAVRRGGGTLAYVGPVSNADLGTFGKLAFDALKSMRYDRLAIELGGSLDGEIISRVLFDGTNETPERKERGGLLGQLTGLPFRFTITIRAPFRGLLNSATSLTDPRGLISQSLPRNEPPLPGSAPVQDQESEEVR